MTFNQIGLILNFLGSIFIAFSFGVIETNARLVSTRNKPIETVSLKHPCLFRWGILFLIIGFLIMLLSTF
jgi:hypothetical protein